MNERRIRVVIASIVLLTTLLAASTHLGGQKAALRVPPPTPLAEKITVRGVPNFGRVSETLYRGGQPTPEGFAELKKLGIEIVVNFRDERKLVEAERQQVEALGMHYANIPWSSARNPKSPQVAEFLELLRANPQKKIFAHCHLGADRTGVMVAAYRIAAEKWTPPQALEEMNVFHFHGFWLPHLKRWVVGFPRQLAADANFRALRPAAQASAP